MTDATIYPVPESLAQQSWCDKAKYRDRYAQSLADPEGFWAEEGKRIHWFKPYTQVKDVSFGPDDVHIRWFHDGTTNVAYNCVDRHLEKRGDQVAIIWEGDDPSESRHITYKQLHEEVSRFANAMKARGIKKGDRVTIYLPMIPEAATAMLACARIGAIHIRSSSAASAPDSLRQPHRRIRPARCVITADEGVRGGQARFRSRSDHRRGASTELARASRSVLRGEAALAVMPGLKAESRPRRTGLRRSAAADDCRPV